MDFVMDQLQDVTRFRAQCTREKPVAIEAGQSLKGDTVVRTLNRSQFTSQAMDCSSLISFYL
jgi:putative transposase